jgi:hypothetical protein
MDVQAIRPFQKSPFDCAWIQVANANTESPGYHSATIKGDNNSFKKQACLPAASLERNYPNHTIRQTYVSRHKPKRPVWSLCNKPLNRKKRMLFAPPNQVDDFWDQIARSTALGILGCSSKIASAARVGVSKNDNDDKVVCCIYVQDGTFATPR